MNEAHFYTQDREKIPNKMVQTRVFYLSPFSRYWRKRVYFGSKVNDFKSLRLNNGLIYWSVLFTQGKEP